MIMDEHEELLLIKIGDVDKMIKRSLTNYENGIANINGYVSALTDLKLIEQERADFLIGLFNEKYVGTKEQKESATNQLGYLLFSVQHGVAF